MIPVLIPKGKKYTKWIGILEFLWNVAEAIIDTRLMASVLLHNVLHGFCTGRVTGTEILELKLVQVLASVDQEPLLLFFLDLQKEYITVDCGCLLTTLKGYGAGPHMYRILAVVWYQQEVITH